MRDPSTVFYFLSFFVTLENMRLYTARHGEYLYNVQGRCNANPILRHLELNDRGRKQAEALAVNLMDKSIEVIYVSELIRAQQTAEAINKLAGVEVIVDPRLNENRTGFEGGYARDWYAAMDDYGDRWTYRHKHGESLEDVRIRVYDWMDDVSNQERDILAVTHKINLRMLAMRLDDLSPDQLWEANVPPQGEYRVDEIAQSTRLGV